MISFRKLRSIFADIRRVIALRRRSKFTYKPRVWQLTEIDPFYPTENYRFLSDGRWYHTRACYVSIDLGSPHSPNSAQIGRVIRGIKEKLFGGEFYMGRRKRKVSKRIQVQTLASISSSIQEILASVGYSGFVYIGVAFGVIRWERRGTEEEEEEEGFNEVDEGEGGGERAIIEGEGAIGENDLLWDEVGESSEPIEGVGGSSESIEGLEALFWDGVGGSRESTGGMEDLIEQLEAMIGGVGGGGESIDGLEALFWDRVVGGGGDSIDGLEALFWDRVVGGGGESIEGVEALIEGLEKVSWENCQGSLEWVTSCVVCLEEFGDCSEVEELRRLPCLHVFHKDCIGRWMERSHLCPLCRFPMTRSIYGGGLN